MGSAWAQAPWHGWENLSVPVEPSRCLAAALALLQASRAFWNGCVPLDPGKTILQGTLFSHCLPGVQQVALRSLLLWLWLPRVFKAMPAGEESGLRTRVLGQTRAPSGKDPSSAALG